MEQIKKRLNDSVAKNLPVSFSPSEAKLLIQALKDREDILKKYDREHPLWMTYLAGMRRAEKILMGEGRTEKRHANALTELGLNKGKKRPKHFNPFLAYYCWHLTEGKDIITGKKQQPMSKDEALAKIKKDFDLPSELGIAQRIKPSVMKNRKPPREDE